MKINKLLFIGFPLFTAFLLTSCGRSVYIAKRQFNDGYYVHVSKKVNAPTDKSFDSKNNLQSTLVNADENKVKLVSAEVIKDSPTVENPSSDNSLFTSISEAPAISHSKALISTTPAKVKQTYSGQQFKEEKKSNRIRNHIAKGFTQQRGGDVPTVVLVLLCIFLPFIAVGIVDNWGTRFLISLLLTLLFWLPGVIYAFIVCFG